MVVEDSRSLARGEVKDLVACAHEIEQHSEQIRVTATRMAEMVQNLLDANRIERGELKLNLAPTELSLLVSSVVETQRPRATAKQQTLHLQNEAAPVMVLVDPSLIVQVLENLLSNAVKYSPPGKNIFVRLTKNPTG